MMKPCLLIFLLLLSIVTQGAQGIRLRKSSTVPDKQHSIHEEIGGKRNDNEGVEEGSKEWSGRIRKLTMIHISSTTTIAKNDKNEEIKADPKLEALSSTNQILGRKEEKNSVNSSSKSQKDQPTQKPNPDTIDMMDYSLQGRRKPPIHN